MNKFLNWFLLAAGVLLLVAIAVGGYIRAGAIWNSDLPMWLKFRLLS